MPSLERVLRDRLRLRDHGVELTAVAATAMLATFADAARVLALFVLLWFTVTRTRNVRRQLFEPGATEWLLVSGAVTRSGLAARYLLDLTLRAALHAVALACLVLVARGLGGGAGVLELLRVPRGGVVGPLAMLLGLELALRGALGVWRHLGSCTWIPPRVRGIANRSTPGPAAQLAFLQDALVLALLLAPVVASLALRAYWGLGAVAVAYLALLLVMLADSEAVEAGGNPPLSLDELWDRRVVGGGLRRPARGRRRALLWVGLRAEARLTLALVPWLTLGVLVQVLAARRDPQPSGSISALLAWTVLGSILVLLFACACLAAETPFRWQSRGPTAEYLHACGVDFGRQRRVELVAGALLILPVAAVAALATGFGNSPTHAVMVLPGVALLFARCIRDTLPLGRQRVEVRRVAAWIGAALLAFWLIASPLEPDFLRRLDRRPDTARWVVAPFVAGALALWLRAWFRSGDEDRVKRELERVAPAGKRAGSA